MEVSNEGPSHGQAGDMNFDIIDSPFASCTVYGENIPFSNKNSLTYSLDRREYSTTITYNIVYKVEKNLPIHPICHIERNGFSWHSLLVCNKIPFFGFKRGMVFAIKIKSCMQNKKTVNKCCIICPYLPIASLNISMSNKIKVRITASISLPNTGFQMTKEVQDCVLKRTDVSSHVKEFLKCMEKPDFIFLGIKMVQVISDLLRTDIEKVYVPDYNELFDCDEELNSYSQIVYDNIKNNKTNSLEFMWT